MKMQRVKELLQNYNRINMRLEYNEMMGFDPENVRVLKSDFTLMNTTMEYIDRELCEVLNMIYKSRVCIRRAGNVLGYSDSTIKRRMRKAIEQTFELSEQSSAF